MIDMLKNLLGAFRYRFWTKKLPAESRRPKKNKKLKSPPSDCLKTIKNCWNAYERFAMLGAISLGLLQLISLNFSESIWNNFSSFLRTSYEIKGYSIRKNCKISSLKFVGHEFS